jgi:hypothetical protein
MSSSVNRTKNLESVISFCILAILVAIATGIFTKQAHTGKKELIDFSKMTPAGFETASEAEVYNAENLYEKIDGKAPLYTESGFEKLYARRFANPADPNLAMELYLFDMGNIRNAFSVYSLQRRADAETLPDFTFAYKTSNALYLVHGRYYAEIIGFSESTGLSKAILEVSRNIRNNIPIDKNAKIPELGFFPQENLVAGSAKFYLASAFGFEGLTNTFTAAYKIDDQTITAFFSKRPGKKDAETTAENYYNFLIANGGVAKTAGNKTFTAKVIELSGAAEIIFTTGSFVGGVHETENRQTAESIAVKLLNKLALIKQ